MHTNIHTYIHTYNNNAAIIIIISVTIMYVRSACRLGASGGVFALLSADLTLQFIDFLIVSKNKKTFFSPDSCAWLFYVAFDLWTLMDEVVRCSFSVHSFLEKIAQGDFVDHEAHIGGAIFGCMCVLLLRILKK